jgi:hypothetical protein
MSGLLLSLHLINATASWEPSSNMLGAQATARTGNQLTLGDITKTPALCLPCRRRRTQQSFQHCSAHGAGCTTDAQSWPCQVLP